MIADLMERCSRQAVAGDVMAVRDESTTLELQDGVVCSATSRESAGTSLRVFVNGTCGWAGASEGSATPDALLEAALTSGAAGEPLEVFLPVAAPMPRVLTTDEDTATMPIAALERLGAGVAERLRADGRRITVRVERALGDVSLANTRGVNASYETTLGVLSVEVQASPGDGVVITRDVLAAVALPSDAEVDQLVADVERRMRWTRAQVSPPSKGRPILLLPRALRQLLRPVERALVASEHMGSWALAGALDEQRFSAQVHISDAPLLPGRPGSRPVDDDGVVAHGHVLVEAGVVRGFLCDLATGARLHRPSTGSARRTVFGPSRPSFSNFILQAGTRSADELLQVLGDGLVIEDLTGGAGAVSSGGSFRFPVASGYRVSGGDVVGRVDGVAISGNAFEMLARVLEVGNDSRWVGSALLPPLLVDGLEVGGR